MGAKLVKSCLQLNNDNAESKLEFAMGVDSGADYNYIPPFSAKFEAVHRFWNKHFASISKPNRLQLNSCLISHFCSGSLAVADEIGTDCEIAATVIDILSHFGAILDIIAEYNCDLDAITQSTAFGTYIDLAIKYEITPKLLVDIWSQIACLLTPIFGSKFSVFMEYCFVCVVMYGALLLDHGTTVKSISTDPSEKSEKSSRRSSLLSIASQNSILFDIECAFHSVLSLTSCASLKTIMAHPQGCELVCRFLESFEGLHPEVVWFWRDFGGYSNDNNDESLAQSMEQNYLTKSGKYSLIATKVITNATAKNVLILCQSGNYKHGFDIVYKDISQWFDRKMIMKFIKSISEKK